MTRRLFPRIPHLPSSRTGPGDRHLHESIARRLTERAERGTAVIVQEKLDGTCVVVQRADGRLGAYGREGRACAVSRNDARRAFADWLTQHQARFAFLDEGERIVGEWLTVAHGTRYALPHEPFVVFDLFARDGRVALATLRARVAPFSLVLPHVLHEGGPLPLATALAMLGPHGHHGAIDDAEGLVYRMERGAHVELVAKYVRHTKVAGHYLSDHSGAPPVMNTWQGDWP